MTDKLNSTDIFVGGLENTNGNLRASEAISAGDPVKFDGTETGNMPDVSVSDTSGEQIAGIALHAASGSGEPVTVAQDGAEVRANASSGSNISPGDQLVAAGNRTVVDSGAASAGDAVVGKALTSNSGGSGTEVVMLVNTGGDFHG